MRWRRSSRSGTCRAERSDLGLGELIHLVASPNGPADAWMTPSAARLSVRVNDQYRITFRWGDRAVEEVRGGAEGEGHTWHQCGHRAASAGYFGTTAQFWQSVQDAWDFWHELRRGAPTVSPRPVPAAAFGLLLALPFRYNTGMDASHAAARSARVVVRRFASTAEAERHDAGYWLTLPASERFLQVWRLSVDVWQWRGERPHEPGLCRSIAVVRRP
jgi:hypothetical protein